MLLGPVRIRKENDVYILSSDKIPSARGIVLKNVKFKQLRTRKGTYVIIPCDDIRKYCFYISKESPEEIIREGGFSDKKELEEFMEFVKKIGGSCSMGKG